MTVTCHEGVALGVALDGDAIFSDNFVDLYPQESVTVSYRPLAEKVDVRLFSYNGKN